MANIYDSPAVLVDPEKGRLASSAKAIEGTVGDYQALLRAAGDVQMLPLLQDDDTLAKEALRWAKKEYGATSPPAKVREIAAGRLRFSQDRRGKDLAERGMRLKEMVKKGAATPGIGDVVPEEAQQKAIQSGKPWRYNKTQAIRELLEEDDYDAPVIADILLLGQTKSGRKRLPEDIRAKLEAKLAQERLGAPEKGGALTPYMDALGARGNVLSGALEGAISVAQERYKDEPIETEGKAFSLKRSFPRVNYAINAIDATQRAMLAGIGGDRPVIDLDHIDDPDVFSIRRSALPAERTKHADGTVSVPQDRGYRHSGVPVERALREWATDPEFRDQVSSAAWEAAKNIVDPYERQQQMRFNTRRAEERYKKASLAQAQKEMGGEADPAGVNARASEILTELKDDDTAIWDPAERQLIQESLLDLGPGTPVSLAWKLAKLGSKPALKAVVKAANTTKAGTKTVETMAKGWDGFVRALSWTPELAALKRSPLAKAKPDLMAELNTARTTAETQAHEIYTALAEKVRKLPKLTDETEKAAVWMAVTDPSGMHYYGLPGRLRKIIPMAQDLAAEADKIRRAAKLGQRYDDATGELLPTLSLENYAPGRVPMLSGQLEGLERTVASMNEVTTAAQHRGVSGPGGSAHHRGKATNPVKDLRLQWEAETRVIKKNLRDAREAQEVHAVLKRNGIMVEMDRPQVLELNHELNSLDNAIEAKVGKLDKMRAENVRLKEARRLAGDTSWEHKKVLKEATPDELQQAARRKTTPFGNETKTAQRTHSQAVLLGREEMAMEKLRRQRAVTAAERGRHMMLDRQFRTDLKRLEVQTGVEWVPLAGDLPGVSKREAAGQAVGDAYRRVTAEPGTVKAGGKMTMVPKPVAERIAVLTKHEMADEPVAVGAYGKFLMYAARPFTTLWRGGNTLLSPAYYALNTTGAVGLQTVAHGIKALDPRYQIPVIRAALLSGGLAGPGAESLRAAKFMLRGGQEASIGQILDVAHKVGVIDASDLKLAMGMDGMGPINAASRAVQNVVFKFGNIPGLKKLSPHNINRTIDNYQHLSVFMGFLDDMTPRGIARATELTSRFAGDYRRMGAFEKATFREGLGFYGWLRFIVPHIVTQMLENPQRLASFQRLREYIENKNGTNFPVFSQGLPEWSRSFAVTAPSVDQGNHGMVEPGADEFAFGMIEEPLSMGLAPIPAIVSTLTGGGSGMSQSIAQYLGPVPRALIETLITGKDLITGEDLRGVFPTEFASWDAFAEDVRLSHATRLLFSPAARVTRMYDNITNLMQHHGPPGAAKELRVRWEAARTWLGLEQLGGLKSLGGRAEGVAAGSPESAIMSVYGANPYKEVRKETMRAHGKR